MNFRSITRFGLLVVLLQTTAYAQNDQNNWTFGSRGAAFFGPTPYTPPPNLFSYEGSSSISDSLGNYYFDTNGETVFHRNHGVMTNGTSLAGNINATQSALIVPWPQTGCKKFFVFTMSSGFGTNGTHHLLSYSVVDMTLSSGFGAVVLKNAALQTGVAEKLAGVDDGAGGFWVGTHACCGSTTANNEFYMFHVTAAGVNPTPVVSPIGHAHVAGLDITGNTNYPTDWGGKGQMQFSTDGSRVGSAVSTKMVEVCDFNKTTGVVTACPALINADLAVPHPPFLSSTVYGFEFEPSGQYFYVSTMGEPLVTTAVGQLVQFNLSNISAGGTAFFASANANRDLGQLQAAPDHKIYVARLGSGFLAQIGNANTSSPTLIANAKAIPSPGFSYWGLPNMVKGAFSCASTSSCPLNTTLTTVNGSTFCCSINDLGQACCKRLCPEGTSETVINGRTQCCAKEAGGLIDVTTAKICCKTP
jgi:hypothetical protein